MPDRNYLNAALILKIKTITQKVKVLCHIMQTFQIQVITKGIF